MSSFDPNCTFPTSSIVNYVSSCNVRGTLDILWSSIFTLFICTWSAQHLNLPKQEVEPPEQSFQGLIFTFARTSWPKTKWMITALVLPEFLVGRAFQDWVMARRSAQNKLMKGLAARDGVTWTMVHAFYANMGGFVVSIQDTSEELPQMLPRSLSDRHPKESDRLTSDIEQFEPSVYAKDLKSHRIQLSENQTSCSNSAPTRPTDYPDGVPGTHPVQSLRSLTLRVPRGEASPVSLSGLNPSDGAHAPKPVQPLFLHASARQLISLRSWNLIPSIPSISTADITCKARGDFLVKATAVGQVLWLFISIVVRAARSLPISQLEIAALAFSTCAFATYVFSWHKPQDVQRANFIGSIEGLTVQQVEHLLELSGHSLSWHMLGFGPMGFIGKQRRSERAALFGPVANDITFSDLEIKLLLGTRDDTEYTVHYTFLGTGTMLASIVFGAVHCVAWDFQFPTEAEKTWWRVASLVSTLVLMIHPLIHTVRAICLMSLPQSFTVLRRGMELISGLLTLMVMVAYFLARLFLMVEIFRSLFFLPPGAFISTWSSSIPHVG